MVCSEQRVLQQCIHLPAISYAYYLLTGNNDHSPVSHTLAGSGSFESDELARQRVPDAADSPPEGSARTPLKPTGPNIISIVRACARICMHALCIRLVFVWCFFVVCSSLLCARARWTESRHDYRALKSGRGS